MCSAPVKEADTKPEPAGSKPMDSDNTNADPRPAAALDPLTCSAHKLAEFLVQTRFEKEPEKAVSFLQAALNNAKTRAASGIASSSSPEESHELGPALTEASELSIITPRAGKYQVTLHKEGLSGTKSTPGGDKAAPKLIVPKGRVQQVICFPKPEDCREATGKKKNGSDMVLMTLEPPITFNNKQVNQITLQLPWEKTEGALKPKLSANASKEEQDPTEDVTDMWCQLLIQSLGDQIEITRVTRNKMGNDFTSFEPSGSSSTTAAMPFVRCYAGVQDGALYPLESGLLFFKPPRFIPRSTLHSIACGRGSSSSNSSRYVDMVIKLHDGSDVEFSNIQREELGVLNNYIHKVLIPAMHQDAAADSPKKKKSDEEETPAKKDDADGDSTEDEDVEAVVEEDDNADDDSDISDEEDDKYNPDMEDDVDSQEEEEEDSDEDDDEDGDFEVVEDDFAKELVKKKKTDDSTESEDDDEDGPRSRSKRRRTA